MILIATGTLALLLRASFGQVYNNTFILSDGAMLIIIAFRCNEIAVVGES